MRGPDPQKCGNGVRRERRAGSSRTKIHLVVLLDRIPLLLAGPVVLDRDPRAADVVVAVEPVLVPQVDARPPRVPVAYARALVGEERERRRVVAARVRVLDLFPVRLHLGRVEVAAPEGRLRSLRPVGLPVGCAEPSLVQALALPALVPTRLLVGGAVGDLSAGHNAARGAVIALEPDRRVGLDGRREFAGAKQTNVYHCSLPQQVVRTSGACFV